MEHRKFMKILRAQVKAMQQESRALEKQYDKAKTDRETRVIERAMEKLDKKMDHIEAVVSRLNVHGFSMI